MNSKELREHVRRLNEQELKEKQARMRSALARIRELRLLKSQQKKPDYA